MRFRIGGGGTNNCHFKQKRDCAKDDISCSQTRAYLLSSETLRSRAYRDIVANKVCMLGYLANSFLNTLVLCILFFFFCLVYS